MELLEAVCYSQQETLNTIYTVMAFVLNLKINKRVFSLSFEVKDEFALLSEFSRPHITELI